MEMLKRQVKVWGRFFDLFSSRNGAAARREMTGRMGRISLSMGNEVLGEWLCMHKPPFTHFLGK